MVGVEGEGEGMVEDRGVVEDGGIVDLGVLCLLLHFLTVGIHYLILLLLQGPNFSIWKPEEATAYTYFSMFFDDQLLQHIVYRPNESVR